MLTTSQSWQMKDSESISLTDVFLRIVSGGVVRYFPAVLTAHRTGLVSGNLNLIVSCFLWRFPAAIQALTLHDTLGTVRTRTK